MAFFVAMISSCSDEAAVNPPVPPTIKENPFKDGELPIDLPVTRAVNDGDPENKVTSARLIVIKNSVVANNKKITVVSAGDETISAVIPVGTVDMFIIVNEDPAWGLDAIQINDAYFPENIEKKVLTFSAYPIVDLDHPIPMYRQFRNLHVSNTGTTFTFDGSVIPVADLGVVERLYAKVTLVINATFAAMANGGDPIKLDHVSIKSMPKYSYLTPSVGLLYPAASGGYFNGADSAQTANYTANATGLHDSIVWYIPEHRLSDPAYMTYISIKASLEDNQDPDEQVEFKGIILGDGAGTIDQDSLRIGKDNSGNNASLNNWFITRNTHYQVKATITSFGKTNESDMSILMKVVGWTKAMTDDWDIWEYRLKVSQDRFYIPPTGAFEGVVTIKTNYPGGWGVTSDKITCFSNGCESSLENQMGTSLRFRYSGTENTYIDVKAGPLTKRIDVIRNTP
jgi:hypothetical protein